MTASYSLEGAISGPNTYVSYLLLQFINILRASIKNFQSLINAKLIWFWLHKDSTLTKMYSSHLFKDGLSATKS
jgi:hypothetical protein